MYRIDRNANKLLPLKTCSFGELGFRERSHLQEWISKEPSALGEDLLIIQKEFSGFSDTNERLDLLALDKQGSLVIIENKLDDAGRDVTWQALKYASYCAGLSRENIRSIYQDFLSRSEPDRSARSEPERSAEERLCDFFDAAEFQELSLNKGVTQRVILVSANFRKEVTSTVLWLMNFKLRLQCFRATPYLMGEELFLNFEQIIPTRDAEDFMIRLAEKAQDEVVETEADKARHAIRKEFWTELLAVMNSKSDLYRNITAPTRSWMSAGSGIRGIRLTLVANRNYGCAEVYIDRGDKTENEMIFDTLLGQRKEIEQTFGGELTWERLEHKQGCRIRSKTSGNIFERDRWREMIEYMTDAVVRLEKAMQAPLSDIRGQLKGAS